MEGKDEPAAHCCSASAVVVANSLPTPQRREAAGDALAVTYELPPTGPCGIAGALLAWVLLLASLAYFRCSLLLSPTS